MSFHSNNAPLCRCQGSAVVDVPLDVLNQLGVWVICHYDALGTEEGGYDAGETGAGAKFED